MHTTLDVLKANGAKLAEAQRLLASAKQYFNNAQLCMANAKECSDQVEHIMNSLERVELK